MRRSTVVYTHGGGRLGNQLIRFSHWIAWAREHEHQVEVLNFAFWPFAELFARWLEYPGCVFPPRAGGADRIASLYSRLPSRLKRGRLSLLLHALGRKWPGWQAISLDDVAGESIDLDDSAFLERVLKSPITTCAGWKIAAWHLVERHRSELRQWFQPAAQWARRGEEFIGALRSRHDLIVGLLIRQTDYRAWLGGRFCFPSTQYAEWIRQLRDLYPDKRVAVVIASDEWQDSAVFAGLPCYFAQGAVNNGGHWFDSFVSLSMCDLVVSPPSTFSASAAFVGNVPILPLSAADQTLSETQILADALIDASRHPAFSLSVK